MKRVPRSLARVLIVLIVLVHIGCATTPVDRWYQAASTVAGINDTVADLHYVGVLSQEDITGDPSEPEQPGLALYLSTMNDSLDRAKERLPEGGDSFDLLLDTLHEAKKHILVFIRQRQEETGG